MKLKWKNYTLLICSWTAGSSVWRLAKTLIMFSTPSGWGCQDIYFSLNELGILLVRYNNALKSQSERLICARVASRVDKIWIYQNFIQRTFELFLLCWVIIDHLSYNMTTLIDLEVLSITTTSHFSGNILFLFSIFSRISNCFFLISTTSHYTYVY